MRQVFDPRALRLPRRWPRFNIFRVLEFALLVLLALQTARLVWAIATPVDPLGSWRLPEISAGTIEARKDSLREFDPFFRLQQNPATAVVTSLQLTLYGTRVDEAMGRGSAIISGPDTIQNSYAVGDEILPGITLKAVDYDNVTIQRGQIEEKLFIDQSQPAPDAPETSAPASAATSERPDEPKIPGSETLTVADLQSGIRFLPRMESGRVTGFAVRPNQGEAFRIAGFQEGDIVTAINGQPVSSVADIQRAVMNKSGGGNISVSVERGANIVPIAITMAPQ